MTRTLRPFRLEVFFSKWEFAARYHLCASDMQSMTLTELLQLATPEDAAAWENLHLGYTETYGRPSLRAAIAATYDKVEPADVLVFAGAQEGIYAAAHALLTAPEGGRVQAIAFRAVQSEVDEEDHSGSEAHQQDKSGRAGFIQQIFIAGAERKMREAQ